MGLDAGVAFAQDPPRVDTTRRVLHRVELAIPTGLPHHLVAEAKRRRSEDEPKNPTGWPIEYADGKWHRSTR